MEISLWAKAIKIAGEKILLTPTDIRTGNDGKPYVPARINIAQLDDKAGKATFTINGCTLWLHLPKSFRISCDNVAVHGGLGVPAWYTLKVNEFPTNLSDGTLTAELQSVALDETVWVEEI